MSEQSSSKKVFWVLDLDRFLLDTDHTYDLYKEVLGEYSADLIKQMEFDQQQIEATGESFDVVLYLKSILNARQLADINNEFLTRAKYVDLLNPYASELLMALEERGLAYGILSHGGTDWQELKIEASGLARVPHLVTDTHHKGAIIGTWWDGEVEKFRIPAVLLSIKPHVAADSALFHSVVLGDDKAVSFNQLPERTRGYLVKTGEPLRVSQKGDAPLSVKIVGGLDQIIEQEFTALDR